MEDKNQTTPLEVRDAIVGCFFKAHCEDSGLANDDLEVTRAYCQSIVRKAFGDVDGDFERPTKESITKVMDKLAEFSTGFRNPEIIKKHYDKIMLLVSKLK